MQSLIISTKFNYSHQASSAAVLGLWVVKQLDMSNLLQNIGTFIWEELSYCWDGSAMLHTSNFRFRL